MMRPPESSGLEPDRSGVFTVRSGARLVIDGRFCVVRTVTSLALIVEYAGDVWSEPVTATLGWAHVMAPGRTAFGVFFDEPSMKKWATYRTSDQTVWFARLALVNLVTTGTRLGHQDLAGPGEPLAGLDHPFCRQDQDLTPRIRILREYLLTDVSDTVSDLLASLNKEGRRPRPAAGEARWVPSQRTIHRWVDDLLKINVWGLMDDRVGKNARGEPDRRRREQSRALVEEVVFALDPKKPHLTAGGVRTRVHALARERSVPADGLLARSQMLGMISKALKEHGKTPAGRKKAAFDRTRGDRASRRPPWACEAYNLDATVSDVEIVAPNGTVFRPYILVITDAATGVILAIWATGHYRQVEVLMTFYEAFHPLVLPEVSPVAEIRVKGVPKILLPSGRLWRAMSRELSRGVIKPGGLPNRIRCDNAIQQTGQQIMPMLQACGVTLSTSRVERSTDNPLAEAQFGALNALLEQLPGYVGRNPKERGRARSAMRGDLLDLEQFNVILQEYAYREHNQAPATGHLYGLRHQISRIDLYDTMIEEVGEVDLLPDTNALFTFLPFRSNGTLTSKGLRHDNLFYDAGILRERGRRFTGLDGHITLWHDPRRRESIYVHEAEPDVFHEIPSVLTHVMSAPLVPQIVAAVKRRSGLRQFSNYTDLRTFAQIAAQVAEDGAERNAIARDYSDWVRSHLWFDDALRRGQLNLATETAQDGPTRSSSRAVSIEDLTTPLPMPEARG